MRQRCLGGYVKKIQGFGKRGVDNPTPGPRNDTWATGPRLQPGFSFARFPLAILCRSMAMQRQR